MKAIVVWVFFSPQRKAYIFNLAFICRSSLREKDCVKITGGFNEMLGKVISNLIAIHQLHGLQAYFKEDLKKIAISH